MSTALAKTRAGLFLEVSDIDAIERPLAVLPLALSGRTTYYGMDEVGITGAGGHLLIFAQPVKDA